MKLVSLTEVSDGNDAQNRRTTVAQGTAFQGYARSPSALCVFGPNLYSTRNQASTAGASAAGVLQRYLGGRVPTPAALPSLTSLLISISELAT